MLGSQVQPICTKYIFYLIKLFTLTKTLTTEMKF